MASDIQWAGPRTPEPANGAGDADSLEKKDANLVVVSDIEAVAAGNLSDENKALLHAADFTELTPAEAFNWDVSGDQSPCECLDRIVDWYACSPFSVQSLK